jgi:DNA-binding CsgD family transcriptional regulator
VDLLASGLAPKQIALARGVSLATVRKHLMQAKRKTGARTLAELVVTTQVLRDGEQGVSELAAGHAAQRHDLADPSDQPEDLINRLSPRQLQVIALLYDGLRYRDIARCLAISERQVGRHVAGAIKRAGVQSSAQLIALLSASGALPSGLSGSSEGAPPVSR